VRFEESRPFTGDMEALWKRVSDVGRIPEFWHGTKELRVMGSVHGRTKARIRFAFGGLGTAEIEIREDARALLIHYVSGPFTGLQEVDVEEGRIRVVWDVEFGGIYRVASKWNEGHFREGSKNALERLCVGLPATGQMASGQGNGSIFGPST
jgi:ribosome-associated toxin RatA of RatAB toxin-antitoxin module